MSFFQFFLLNTVDSPTKISLGHSGTRAWCIRHSYTIYGYLYSFFTFKMRYVSLESKRLALLHLQQCSRFHNNKRETKGKGCVWILFSQTECCAPEAARDFRARAILCGHPIAMESRRLLGSICQSIEGARAHERILSLFLDNGR